ncbi:flagellin N-terminal helical domain-containing protein [Oceanotoga teriensis]|uniref:flagellin N-terminal helical domain-containing protein n=1 Tax=Oceanotoga teriensis TaxID=515440 RepID=UPI002712ED86|nr:flagellin [Oceanotoga teriensis]MDO7976073.1 flagellin [Oceanotoga teriensis]
MRINHNLNALNAWRNLGNANSGMGKSLEKLSSGLRINRAGDDAAGLAISEKMRAQIKGYDMATKNAQDGISLIQTAEGALTEVHSMLQRMREISVQAANDTNNTEDRAALKKEVDQLVTEIDRIGSTTKFNGSNLFASDASFNLQIGPDKSTSLVLKVKSQAVSSDVLAINGLDISSNTYAQTSISKIDGAIKAVSSLRAQFGAYQNRLEHTVNNLSVASENLTAAESRIRDVDMAKEMMSFTREQILLQSSNAMLAQSNQLPQNVLSLLR